MTRLMSTINVHQTEAKKVDSVVLKHNALGLLIQKLSLSYLM